MPKTPANRIVSIDIARGLTTFFMILVNDPGDPHEVYPQLRHADWNGYTAADLVFPNFLFLAGASLVFSLQSRLESGRTPRLELARGLARRSVNLVLVKLVLAAIPTMRLRRIRIFGVLARIALCSLGAGLILLTTLEIPVLLAITGALLTGYWAALRIPFGSLHQPLLDPENNLTAWLDRKVAHLFHGHLHHGALYNVTHDPEGLLSTVPALATTLIGSAAALLIRRPDLSPDRKRNTLALAGATSLGAGYLWHRSFPINKNLWTSSYVLVSAGWSLLSLAALYWLCDQRRLPQRSSLVKAITTPANIFGANALVAYAVSVAGHKLSRTRRITYDDHDVSLRTFAYRKTFARPRSTPARSLAFAVTYAALCLLPNLALWRRKIFVKI